jgi:hypothetical protein
LGCILVSEFLFLKGATKGGEGKGRRREEGGRERGDERRREGARKGR